MDIRITDLHSSYGEKKVLQGINLEVSGFSTVTVVGASGSGKSTFLRLLSGLKALPVQTVKGAIMIDGLTPNEFMNRGNVGYMFQTPALLRNQTVADNIKLPLKLRNQCDDRSFADHLINKMGLDEFKSYMPHQLSGGMKTRVSLARTIATRPKLLLLDEPFGSLDVGWKYKLYGELIQLQEEVNFTTILVTHDIQEALLLTNHIVVLGRTGTIEKEIKVTDPLPRIFKENPLEGLWGKHTELLEFFRHEKMDISN